MNSQEIYAAAEQSSQDCSAFNTSDGSREKNSCCLRIIRYNESKDKNYAVQKGEKVWDVL